MNFKLRKWHENDVESLVYYANNINIAKYLTNKFPHPFTTINAVNFIAFAKEEIKHSIFAIEINNQAVGGIGIHLQDDVYCKNAELGYWLGEPFWGNNVISKAIVEITNYGFEYWDINRIYGRCFGNNIASQRVLQKANYILEAHLKETFFKNGEYLDEYIYAKRKNT